RMQTAARLAAVRRRLAACVVVSIVLGYALSQVLTAGHPSVAALERHHRLARPAAGLSSLPPDPHGPISAALCADDPAYQIRASRSGGFQPAAPTHRLRSHLR